jgi:tyrosine-protein phosphatase YwqE
MVITVDLHSHLIPGIDDGSKTLEESLTLIRRMVDMGYEKLIMTPHVMSDAYRNTPETILAGLEKLKKAVADAGITVELEASAEYYLDEGFLNILEQKQVLPIAGKYLLFETSYLARPNNLLDLIYAIKVHGYIPILAHPERYRYIKEMEREYRELKELDVLFQIDTTSLGGHYGKDAQKKALFLMRKGWIDFVGSDTHRMKHLEDLERVMRDRKLWDKLTRINTLRNEELR